MQQRPVEHSHTQQLADESQQRAIGHPDLEHLVWCEKAAEARSVLVESPK